MASSIAFGDFSQDSDLVNYDTPSMDAEPRSVTSKHTRQAQAEPPPDLGRKDPSA